MKPITDKTMDVFEETALIGAKAMRQYLTYEGENKKFLDKAKVGAQAVSAYARVRASESNRMQVELIAERVGSVASIKMLER
jgi:hypothetical protein